MLLIVASTGAGFAVGALPRSYQSEASVVLLASPSASRQNGGNPYLSFSPSLTLTANALSQQVMAPATIQHLASAGSADPYTVALAPYTATTSGSVLLVTVTGSSATAAEREMYAVTREIGTKLADLQSKLKPRNRIQDTPLSFSPDAALSISQTARPLVIVAALGLLLVFGIPIVVDGRIARRRLMKATAPLPETAPDHVLQPSTGQPPAGPARAEAAARQRPPDYLSPSRHGGHAPSAARRAGPQPTEPRW
jgi:hypothetical protein